MENSKEITIYDIAKSLDLSPSTISRALNDDPTISKKTKKKIFDTAAEMGYRSNQFARNLRQQHTLTIGVMLEDLNNAYMTPVLSGIERIAAEAGYGIIVTDSSQNPKKEAENAQNLFRRRVDGLIVTTAPGTGNLDHFKPFVERNIPIIFLDQVSHISGSTSIVIDNALCGYHATSHLIDQGCRRVALLAPETHRGIYAQRYKGYREALTEHNIPFDEKLVITAPPTEQGSETAAATLLALDHQPDGLFATSDLVAAVCIRCFQAGGLRVPQDIAVIGFNNEVIGKLITPTLTTVNYPGKEMGETAARSLLSHLKGHGDLGNISTLTLRADLVIRQSSLKKSPPTPK